MEFNRRHHSFDAFDGKVILTAIIDFPVGGAGIVYEYLNRFTNNCYKFVSTGFYDKLRSKYISEYHNRISFDKVIYILEIKETFASESISSYLITIIVKQRGDVKSFKNQTLVFYRNMLVPPRLISKRHSDILIDAEGVPCKVNAEDGMIKLERISNNKIFEI